MTCHLHFQSHMNKLKTKQGSANINIILSNVMIINCTSQHIHTLQVVYTPNGLNGVWDSRFKKRNRRASKKCEGSGWLT